MAAGRAGLRRTRFAPSPTGLLHLGHAHAALVAQGRADPGEFLIRIEDLDRARCRPEHEAAIFRDLAWLGLDWAPQVWRQSERAAVYRAALVRLAARGLTYPCRCTRGDIRAALSAPQEGAPVAGPDGLVYPGTCRGRPMAEAAPGDAIRLDMRRALAALPRLPSFTETGALHAGCHRPDPDWLVAGCGDVILWRRDMGAAYHLAVVVDDAAQGITEVTRGADLFEATFLHVLLQALLDLPVPAYHHHALIRDDAGKRLAKRDDARALATLRAEGASPADIRAMIAAQIGA
ncbi:tRNA glutamyl-Q(34) synthetase GluQRS [Phaeovulum vinaykumarii]|uniref:Glutamyl-Q tRNA(Asp) synthetase n=1 Tax=Phaeovulum vinaykumarii TaxID=407234 RepID=A0A1N7LH29_9RHOB|nr:tRNA glutamyl-Q(34) synthetase GluQRS [Phaeovulum vinaykumarii]SIS73086.1 glutamyl-Q tRNA(Asp) synthetase [Phaeovulum vinaykumarii]SOC04618.1 glutamyl-Q tRNA(Asp) synthetase [Phaeovulum vinaykumarii]